MATTVYSAWSASFVPSGSSVAKKYRSGIVYTRTESATAVSVTAYVVTNINSSFYSTYNGSFWGDNHSTTTGTCEISFSKDNPVYTKTTVASRTFSWSRTHSAQTKYIYGTTKRNASSGPTTAQKATLTVSIPARASYTVSYNANGGTGAPSNQTKWNSETLTLSSTKPTRTGYVFKCWNTNANGTGTNYNAGASYTGNAALALYAIWNPIITYNSNGGTGSIASQTKTFNINIALSNGAGFSRTNYLLKGWNTSADRSGIHYALGATYTENTPLDLYAEWHEVPMMAVSVTSSAPYYTRGTTYSVEVSDIETYDEATVTSITLTLGDQTDSSTEAGELSIAPSVAGDFVPTVSIRDSYGATRTIVLPAITVNQYLAPTIQFEIERAEYDGQESDEGMSVLATATFSWISDVTTLTIPTVEAIENDGTVVSSTITWYKSLTSSGSVDTTSIISDWSDVSPSDMPIYCLLDNGSHTLFDPNKSYDIVMTPVDGITSGRPMGASLTIAFYTIDFLAEGHGIAFGQPALNEGFYCRMDANFMQGVLIDIDTTAASGTDYEIYASLQALGWDDDCIV